MKLLDKYNSLRQQLFDYFGYVEDCRILPIDDARQYYWYLTGESYGDEVCFAKYECNLFKMMDIQTIFILNDICPNGYIAEMNIP
jgi:hypothetical protein